MPELVCIIGSEGKIGSRYKQILKNLNQPACYYDAKLEYFDNPQGPWHYPFDSAIICSPTDTHVAWVKALSDRKIPLILCEKPLHTDMSEARSVAGLNFSIVNNYVYAIEASLRAIGDPPRIKALTYKYYNTGGDGLWFDLSQLCYICKKHGWDLRVDTNSTVWRMSLDCGDEEIDVNYSDVERSYITMLKDFIEGRDGPKWNSTDAIEMTRASIEATHRHTGENGFYQVTWKDL